MDTSEFFFDARPLVRQLLTRVLPLLVVYYTARLLGCVPYIALSAAILFTAGQALFGLIRERKIDTLTICVLLFLGANVAIALTTRNAQTTMMANLAFVFLVDFGILISGLIQKPATLMLIGQFLPNLTERAFRERNWQEEDLRAYRAVHSKVSVFTGAVALASDFIVLALIFNFSMDVVQLFAAIVGEGRSIAVVLIDVRWIRRFTKRRNALVVARSHDNAERPSL